MLKVINSYYKVNLDTFKLSKHIGLTDFVGKQVKTCKFKHFDVEMTL